MRTFSHEFVHFIEKWNPIWYNELRKVVFDTLTERGENVDVLITAKMEKTEGMDYDAASREVLAEAMTDILPDANFVEELATKHKNIFQKLLDMLKEFVADLKAYFNSISYNPSREANALKEQVGEGVKYLENIVKLFDKVAVEAVENYQATVAVEEADPNGLTDNEKGALLSYKSGGSYSLNAKIRDGTALTEYEQSIVDNLDRALEKLPTHKGKVYRNISFDGFGDKATRDAFVSDHVADDIIKYPAYTSTSTELDGYPIEGEFVVHLEIESTNGRNVEGYGNNSESEVLFPRNTVFVTDKIIYDSKGIPTIYLTEATNEQATVIRGRTQETLSVDNRGQQKVSSKNDKAEVQRLPAQNTENGEVQPAVSGRNTERDISGGAELQGVQAEVNTTNTEEVNTNVENVDNRETVRQPDTDRQGDSQIEEQSLDSAAEATVATEIETNNTDGGINNAEQEAENEGRTDTADAGSNARTLSEDGDGRRVSQEGGERRQIVGQTVHLRGGQRELGQKEKRFSEDSFIVPQKRTAEAEAYAKIAEYGIEGYVVKKSAWDRSVQAFSRGGKVYIREDLDERYRKAAAPHEATHVMKQLQFQPYLDFIERTPAMLDMSSEEARQLINQPAKHYNIDLSNADETQITRIYDEINATVYGSYVGGQIVGEIKEKINNAFYDFDAYINELTAVHKQFKKENAQHKASGNASIEEREAAYKKKFSQWLKKANRQYVLHYGGESFLSNGALGIRAAADEIGWARLEFSGMISEMDAPAVAKNALDKANTLLTEAPIEGRLGEDKAVYVFNVDGNQHVFDKKLLLKLDGNLLYIGNFNKGATIIKAVDADGKVAGFLLPLRINSEITNTKPSKLKSFANKIKSQNSKRAELDSVADDTVQEQSRAYLGDSKYSYEWFTSKPDMKLTTVDAQVPDNRADVIFEAKKNAAQMGKVNPKDGSVSVYVEDIDTDVILGKDGLKHSLDRRLSANAPIVVKAGEIISNSIRINELTPQKSEADKSYVLIGAAQNANGEIYIVRSVVNKFSNELTTIDVLYAINAKKENRLCSMHPRFQHLVTDSQESAALLPKITDKSATPTDSNISIAQLLEFVNRYFPDILPEDVLRHFGHVARPDGVIGRDTLYQQRTNTLTDREILQFAADNLESANMTEAERDALQIFKKRVANLENLQSEREEQGRLYKEQQFTAPVDRKAAEATLNR